MRSRAAIGMTAGVAVLLLAAVFVWRPYATKSRIYTTTVAQAPSKFAVQLIPLKARQRACLDAIALDARSGMARFQVGTNGKPTVPLEFQVSAPGYRAKTPIAASAYRDSDIIQTRIPAPGRDVEATACVVNRGRGEVVLYASTGGEISASHDTIDGKPADLNWWLAFYEAHPTSIAHRAPTIAARMSVFRPGFVGPWLIWPLAALIVLGVPAAVLAVYGRALRDDPDG
jgi:hypothetical protein